MGSRMERYVNGEWFMDEEVGDKSEIVDVSKSVG